MCVNNMEAKNDLIYGRLTTLVNNNVYRESLECRRIGVNMSCVQNSSNVEAIRFEAIV